MRWQDLAAIALGIAAAVLSHYLPDQSEVLRPVAVGLVAWAIPRPSAIAAK